MGSAETNADLFPRDDIPGEPCRHQPLICGPDLRWDLLRDLKVHLWRRIDLDPLEVSDLRASK